MRLPPATGGSLVSSLDNYHREIIDRVQTGDLQLGVSKMAGADQRSIAFSKFWTSFPFLAVVSCVGIPWHLESELFWGYVIFSPAIFVVGVCIFRPKPITVPGQADHFRPPCGCRFFPTPTRRITATPWHPLRLFSEGSVHGLYEVINAQDTRDLTAASQRSPIQPGHCPQSETVTGDGERLPGSSPGSGGELATARDDDGHRCGAGAVPTTTARLAHTPRCPSGPPYTGNSKAKASR